MPPNHPILCRPLLLLPSIFPSIKVFSNELAFHIRWSKYWSFSISLSNKYSEWFPLGLTGLILLSKGLSRVFSSTTIWKHQFFGSYLEHLLRLLESVPPKSLKPLVKSIFLFAAPWIFFFFCLTIVPLFNILNNCCTDFQDECILHLHEQHQRALAPHPHQHLLFFIKKKYSYPCG